MSASSGPASLFPLGGGYVPYYLCRGLLKVGRGGFDRHLEGRRALLITDENVALLYGEALAERLDVAWMALPPGEEHKQWPAVERTACWLVGCGVERGDVLIALGGGVVTDLVGFAAAVMLRGIAWLAVPTTLLGMVDASIGGKTGIDLELGKNLIGAFWPPLAVFADPEVLATLDGRQRRAGLAEVVKAGMIAPATLTHVLDANLGRVATGDLSGIESLIHAAARVKGEIVAADNEERGPRAALNLGHTLGHALEAATGYSGMLHGEAVAWGLLATLRLARERGLISRAEALAWCGRVGHLAPLPPIEGLSWALLAPFVGRDKKRNGGRIGWVLPRDGGVVMGVDVSDREVAGAFEALKTLPAEGPFTGVF